MKSYIHISFVLILLLTSPIYAQQRDIKPQNSSSNSEKRVALVIGNSAYTDAPLKNPVNDARDMAQALAALGFEVIHKENLNQNDMKRAIREFGSKIRNGGVGLFYYAGHGVAVKGINYLVPVDAQVESEEEVEYECVDAGFVLAQMESARNRLNIVIMDACRNNPFARSFRSASRGLAVMDAPSGTLIAYATAPGSVASDGNDRNGLYTQELLKFMQTPGVSIEELFKQVRISVRKLTDGKQTPWEASSLTGDFYFSGKSQVAKQLPTFTPIKFQIDYKGEPEPGIRIWYQKYADIWIERYPGGRETTFRLAGKETVKGISGIIVETDTLQVFIPDRESQSRWLMFRHMQNKQVISDWAYLAEIVYID